MSDLILLKTLFSNRGIPFIEGVEHDSLYYDFQFHTRLTLEVDKEKHIGYTGFFTEFFFDQDGKLIKMGTWE